MGVRTSGHSFNLDDPTIDPTVDILTCNKLIVAGTGIDAVVVAGGGSFGNNVSFSSFDASSPCAINSDLQSDSLVVNGTSTLTGDVAAGNVNMGSGKVLTLAAGTLAAPSLRFAGSNAGTGLSAQTADAIVEGRAGVAHRTGSSGGMTFGVPVTLPAGTLAAPSLKFTGSDAGTGLSAATADTLQFGRIGTSQLRIGVGGNNIQADQSIITGKGIASSILVKTANYTLTTAETDIVFNDGGGSALTATMPATPAQVGVQVRIWNAPTSANPLTIARSGAQTINGAASVTIAPGAVAEMTYVASNDWRAGEAPAA